MRILCTICARGGSQGVKNKNLRIIAGKPLIAHTIIQAKEAGLFTAIVVSSDSPEILHVARDYGVDAVIQRPNEMATSTAAKLPVIQHAFQSAEALLEDKFDILVDLDATSPLRSVADIKNAVQKLKDEDATNVLTAAPARRSPYFNMVETDDNDIVHLSKSLKERISRRQDSPKVYDMNASIYVWWKAALLEEETIFLSGTKLYEMPEERSLDIDSELDFKLVKFLMENK